jgi:hypothetical protein
MAPRMTRPISSPHELLAITQESDLPVELPVPVRALWFDARGEWSRAHSLAQNVEDRDGAWVHAYLHRKEGDPDNAAYWYRRAGKPIHTGTLDNEWREIVSALL